ncbi:MAG: DEAD/DEAH box helicase [Proteobacteria bacterium]|nr:DEAD/DEAH box helicase [Pseudomonadota bacterium]
MTFEDLKLSPDVLRAVTDAGYTEPTPIQELAIPYVQMGRDILGCAQTGTGKTASFVLPMIDILTAGRARARMPRSLILTPTRELAAQIAVNFETYGKYHKLSMALIIGGESIVGQEQKLDRGVDVLIATPGRLIDHFGRGGLLLNDVKILVIDEGDRMLDMGFIPDIERIVSFLPKIRQTLFFSATFPPEIRRLADKFLINPKEINVTPPASPAEMVDHFLVPTGMREKGAVLRRLLNADQVQNALIFCNRKRDVDILAISLKRHGLSAAGLHGDMPQPARTETLRAFKAGEINLLVATDVAGRGLDIRGLSHVFNFDVPIHAEDYVHRIGRTGRAGHRGRAITLTAPDERKFLSAITTLIGKDIPRLDIPGIAGPEDDGGAAEARPAAEPEARRPDAKKSRRGDGRGRNRRDRKAAPGTGKGGDGERTNGTPIKVDKRTPVEADKRTPKSPPKEQVVGLGDHVPAFMMRPPKKPTDAP